MMGNWAGVAIIAVALFLVIAGIQGSWAKFFPWIMSNTSTASGPPPTWQNPVPPSTAKPHAN